MLFKFNHVLQWRNISVKIHNTYNVLNYCMLTPVARNNQLVIDI